MPFRILVVDDHDVVRQGVRLILNSRPEWEICGEAEDGADALAKERSLNPDLVVLDITMPGKDGLEVTNALRARKSRAKILVLTMHDSKELAGAVRGAGAEGYVIKSHAARDLVAAIETIKNGGTFFTVTPAPTKPEKSSKKSPLFRLILIPSPSAA